MDILLPRALSAKYENDFAYATVKDRMPVIISKAVDTVYRYKDEMEKKYPENAVDDLKSIVELLSKLRYELQTNKPLTKLEDSYTDVEVWNQFLDELVLIHNCEPKWFESDWLYVECYMYRRIYEAISLSSYLKSYDPFHEQKSNSFLNSTDATTTLIEYLEDVKSNSSLDDEEKMEEHFKFFTAIALWGNKCDLSISGGSDNSQQNNPVNQVKVLQNNLLVDDTDCLYKFIKSHSSKNNKINLGVILDNAGFELISDLCFVQYLIHFQLVNKVTFYVKAFPWFVSDTTESDFKWTLEQLILSSNSSVSKFAKEWEELLEKNLCEIKVDSFWTYPYDFSHMKTISSNLYEELSKFELLIFKGDLNYRKLTCDRKWNPSTSFSTALNGFLPSSLVALRTLKADIVVGLSEDTILETQKMETNWMVSGNYGLIQFLQQ